MGKTRRKTAPQREEIMVAYAPKCGVCDDESKDEPATLYGRTARGLEPLCNRHFDRCLVPSKAQRYVVANPSASPGQ